MGLGGVYRRMPAGSPSAWTPASIDGLALWLDASDESTITLSSGAVSQWNDKSGNARHATQGTSDDRPVVQVAAINGRNALRFDGTNDFLAINDGRNLFRNAAAATVYAVAKTTTPSSSLMRIFHASVGDNNSNNRVALVAVSGAMTFRVRRLDGDSESSLSGGVIASDTAQIFRGHVDYANRPGALFVNGDSVASNATLVSEGSTSNTDSHTIQIARSPGFDGSQYWSGDIAEILALPRLLTSAESETVDTYLATKWGVTLA